MVCVNLFAKFRGRVPLNTTIHLVEACKGKKISLLQ